MGLSTAIRTLAIPVIAWAVMACAPLPGPVAAAPTAARLHCAPRAGGADGLDTQWTAFARFIDECTLSAGKGVAALKLISVSAARLYADRPSGAVTVELPKPLLLSPSGRLLGSLPYSYPDDPPYELELGFSDWHDGLPWQIDLLVRDPTPSGDRHPPALRWSAANQRYDSPKP